MAVAVSKLAATMLASLVSAPLGFGSFSSTVTHVQMNYPDSGCSEAHNWALFRQGDGLPTSEATSFDNCVSPGIGVSWTNYYCDMTTDPPTFVRKMYWGDTCDDTFGSWSDVSPADGTCIDYGTGTSGTHLCTTSQIDPPSEPGTIVSFTNYPSSDCTGESSSARRARAPSCLTHAIMPHAPPTSPCGAQSYAEAAFPTSVDSSNFGCVSPGNFAFSWRNAYCDMSATPTYIFTVYDAISCQGMPPHRRTRRPCCARLLSAGAPVHSHHSAPTPFTSLTSAPLLGRQGSPPPWSWWPTAHALARRTGPPNG